MPNSLPHSSQVNSEAVVEVELEAPVSMTASTVSAFSSDAKEIAFVSALDLEIEIDASELAALALASSLSGAGAGLGFEGLSR